MSSAGGEDEQLKISDRDKPTIADEKSTTTTTTTTPPPRGDKAKEESHEWEIPPVVRVGGYFDRRGQPASAAPKTGSDVGRDEVAAKDVATDVSGSLSEPLAKAILDAISTRVPAAVAAVLATMDGEDVTSALTSLTPQGMPVIAHAARTGNVDMFVEVHRSMAKHLSLEQVRKTFTVTAENGRGSLLVAAAEGGSAAIFSKVVRLLDGEVLRTVAESWSYGSEVVVNAAQDGGLATFRSVTSILRTQLTREQAIDAITLNAAGGATTLTAAVQGGNQHVVWAWAEVLLDKLPRHMVIEASTASFAACLKHFRSCLDTMSVLVALGADVTAAALLDITQELMLDELKSCFLAGISSAENPFTAGMALSVAIETAVRMLPERERRNLSDLQCKLDELLLEVLERLPQSIHRFPRGIDGCVAIFEPETVGVRAAGYRGPLMLALQEGQFTETICVSPLVFEYMSHKFISGLPMPWDSEDHITSTYDRQRGSFSDTDGMVAASGLGRLMQGLRRSSQGRLDRPRDWEKLLSSTIYPGAQFVVAGVITKPMAFYKVPSIRMALDFIVHLFMLAVYTAVVLEDDDGTVSKSEIALMFHVVAEIVSEVGQMSASFHEYVQDEWNWLESISLLLLAGALFYRIGNSDGETGRALFALSAPLVFSRVLFFGQVLRRQGLVVQAITIMIGEILQFALVIGVIMMGFTVAFFAIFSGERSFGDIWLDVFKAMLGEVGVFDEFFDDIYGTVGRFLLVIYLLVMAVMLLNLLIAILSTEHAKIEQGSDIAFRVSKVRIMKLYSRIVDKDSQPPPFNLVQLTLALPFLAVDRICKTSTHGKVKRMVGGFVFWLVMGPLSVLALWGLCVASIPSVVLALWRGTLNNRFRGTASVYFVFSTCIAVLFRVLCVPVILSALWENAGAVEYYSAAKDLVLSLFRGEGEGAAEISPSAHDEQQQQQHRGESNTLSVAELLKRARGGKSVREIWVYLDDLASTADVHGQRTEKNSPATAEHLNRTRSQLQSSSEKRGQALLVHLQSIDVAVRTGVQELGQRVNHRVDALDSRVDERLDRLEEKMAAMVAEYLAKLGESSALAKKS